VPETWTIQRVLTWTSEFFSKKGIDSPRLTSELLLSHALGCDRVRLYMEFDRPLNKDELAACHALVERKAVGEPTFYLLGAREFFGRRFLVDRRVLVPRPETELVAEAALERLGKDAQATILELCTGSGCIGLTLLGERSGINLVAVDSSAEALEVARENALALRLDGRAEILQGDLFAPVAGRQFAMIVANPPYVVSSAIAGLMPEVRYEPRVAIDGGEDGLSIIRRIVAGASSALEPGGWLVLEIGEGQGATLLELFRAASLVDGSIRKDLADLERIALARRPPAAS
jgi:release factor glutamine methyltransferase